MREELFFSAPRGLARLSAALGRSGVGFYSIWRARRAGLWPYTLCAGPWVISYAIQL